MTPVTVSLFSKTKAIIISRELLLLSYLVEHAGMTIGNVNICIELEIRNTSQSKQAS